MKLTNDQIYALQAAGIGKINYSKLNPVDAISAYRLRRDVVAAIRDLNGIRDELIEAGWEDKDLLHKVQKYEASHKGMTEDEYKAAMEANMPKVAAMMVEVGKEERDINVKPITFTSWLQLLQDNPWLAGFEELLADFINDND